VETVYVVSVVPPPGFGVELVAGGPSQTKVRPVPEVNEWKHLFIFLW